ncbi:unnamed protein product, partial [Ectocarpus fasciculatus]
IATAATVGLLVWTNRNLVCGITCSTPCCRCVFYTALGVQHTEHRRADSLSLPCSPLRLHEPSLSVHDPSSSSFVPTHQSFLLVRGHASGAQHTGGFQQPTPNPPVRSGDPPPPHPPSTQPAAAAAGIVMSGFPPPSNSLPPVNIGQSASAAAGAGAGGSVDGSSTAGSTTTSGTTSTAATAGAVPDMSSIVSGGGELYGNMMVGSVPAMGGGLGESAPPSPELGPVPSANRSGKAGPVHHSRAALMCE